MFKPSKIFTPGWHLVEITNADVIMVKNQYEALSLELKNKDQLKQTFLIFTNNWILIKQLLDASYDHYNEDEEIDEKELIDIVLNVYLEEKNNLLVITEIQAYEENHAA